MTAPGEGKGELAHENLRNEGIAALSEFLLDEGTLGDTLLKVAQLACQVCPADMAGITMLVEGRPRTGVFTDDAAPEIEDVQYATGNGPCLDAFRTAGAYRIDDTSTEDRWPEFAQQALGHGVHSTLSMPVVARGQPLGALNLYAREAAAFTHASEERTTTFARQAAVVLANARVYWDARELSENLQQALNSRATIDQAIGIILASGGRSPEEAFQVLVRASQRENRKLRDIATDMVRRASQRQRAASE